MLSIRENVFESNSSSCHCLTTISKDTLKEFEKEKYDKCIYFPNTEEYCTDDKYEILDRQTAFEKYNTEHEEQNKQNAASEYFSDLKVKTYPHSEKGFEEWEDDLESNRLDDDLGKYLTFKNLLVYIVIESDLKFSVDWWNND